MIVPTIRKLLGCVVETGVITLRHDVMVDGRLDEVARHVPLVAATALGRPPVGPALHVFFGPKCEGRLEVPVGVLCRQDLGNPILQGFFEQLLGSQDLRVPFRVDHEGEAHGLHRLVDPCVGEDIAFVDPVRLASEGFRRFDEVVDSPRAELQVVPVDHLYAAPAVLEDVKARFTEELVVVSPDAGGTERARAFAKRLNAGLAIIDKRRSAANVSEVMHIIGDVDGRTCIIVDDMIDTAGTLCQAAAALKAHGAGDVYATATHAVLSGPALERINESDLKEVLVCNTIPTEEKVKNCSRLRTISVANILAEAIRRIHGDESVSSLFV